MQEAHQTITIAITITTTITIPITMVMIMTIVKNSLRTPAADLEEKTTSALNANASEQTKSTIITTIITIATTMIRTIKQ